MKKVLIVSPHFPPINAPDHQRVRMALPYFPQNGWQAEILTVNADYVEGVHDPLLTRSLPEGIQVIATSALPVRYTRRVGLGSLALRALPFLLKAGNRLLRTQRYDLVLFSTTMFPVMTLGPYWLRKFRVPYVLDFQDPWLSDYYQNKNDQKPPGGRFKYGFSQFLARHLEPYALKRVSHVITVSPAYPAMLQHRYPWLQDDQFTVIPFGAAENDFTQLPRLNVRQQFFAAGDGKRHWVYVGRGGKDMAFALRGFFTALYRARLMEPEKWNNLELHFIGTDYAPNDMARKTIEPVAEDCGIGDMVREHPQRIPYFEALQCLMDADALIVPGSDDPGYTASKLYPYILAKKPLLAIFHEQSSVIEVLRTTGGGTVVTFKTGNNNDSLADDITEKWFKTYPPAIPTTDWNAFEHYSARNMTRRLCASFDKCLSLGGGE
jgi:hypothetical protein